MNYMELFLIGVGLGMDAMSVSISKGLAMKQITWKNTIKIGLYFGIFQTLMPIIGFILGSNFKELMERVSKWIAFGSLEAIGINMILESKKENSTNDSIKLKDMLIPAIATSIDALIIGMTFGIIEVSIIKITTIIGSITFLMSIIGVKIGNTLGNKLQLKAEVLGGIILISIGMKILIS